MIDPASLASVPVAPERPRPPPFRRWLPALLALILLAGIAALWATAERAPSDTSLEAGFARDMMVHHDQAVTMALLARDRTDDPLIRTLTTDIVLTQQNQIGQMLGWLNLWGLPATGREPAMAWMGHPTTGRMPGMASPEEIATLEGLAGTAADAEFLRLMIRHHQAGVPMAEAALTGSGNPAVRALARQIVTAQEIEIVAMQNLLAEKDSAGEET